MLIVILGQEDSNKAVDNVDDVILEPSPGASQLQVGGPDCTDNLWPSNEQPGCSTQDEAVISVDNELDPELLSALGESMFDTPEYGEKINDNLSKLWLPLLKKGMPKENKDKLLKEYLIPDNCKLLQAPTLNAEISAAVPDMVRNRDKALVTSQQQLGLGITALNRGIDILLKSDNKAQAIKHLSNGCRLLCDSHSIATKNRIKLITPSLDKTFFKLINESDRDETLFGSSLSDKIKTAKAIEKQGQQIKKPPAKTPKPGTVQSNVRPAPFQGNWSAPPRYPPTNRGGRGGFRKPHNPMAAGARRSYSTSTQQPQRAAMQDKSRAPTQTQH